MGSGCKLPHDTTCKRTLYHNNNGNRFWGWRWVLFERSMYQAQFLSNAVQSHLLTSLLPKYEIFFKLCCFLVYTWEEMYQFLEPFIYSSCRLTTPLANQIKNSIHFTYIKIQTNSGKTKHVLWYLFYKTNTTNHVNHHEHIV